MPNEKMRYSFISFVTVACWRYEKVVYSFSVHKKTSAFFHRSRWQLFSTTANSDSWSQLLHQQKYRQLISASTLSLAPMMEYTDRHFRHLVRLISSNALLYTEMVTANAIVQHHKKMTDQELVSDPKIKANALRRFLGQGQVEPLEGASVLQLGGSDPATLAMATAAVLECSNFGREYNHHGFCDYTAINLNCGCPSPKVAGSGCFGAALMEQPHLVKDCVLAMSQGCNSIFPITLKCRIGTDENIPFQKGLSHTLENKQQTYEKLCKFIDIVSSSGVVSDFQIHARIAVLDKNFTPLDNRNIPPLQYDLVYQLVRDFPHLSFSLNGGVTSIDQVQNHFNMCQGLKGVMIGRSWVSQPWSFGMADNILYNDPSVTSFEECDQRPFPLRKPKNRLEVLQAYGMHADKEEKEFDSKMVRRPLLKAITNLFAGEPNARKYRIALDNLARNLDEAPLSNMIMKAALDSFDQDILLRTPQESYSLLGIQK